LREASRTIIVRLRRNYFCEVGGGVEGFDGGFDGKFTHVSFAHMGHPVLWGFVRGAFGGGFPFAVADVVTKGA
jgi:hypothetical protein